MAKTNIVFNNTSYSIEEASLSAATADLRAHLSNTLNGSGAVIDFGGTSYNVDSAKLTAATTEFVSHLGTIAGSGSKVSIGGIEYGIDSAKVANATASLQTAFGNLASGSTPTPDVPTEERLEGDGAEFYTLAPTALSFRSTAPLNELQEVQINGVTVDPSNYTLEEGSTIVTFPIDYLKTLNVGNYEVDVVSDSKTVKGGFTVAAPELNEHGFYYNQPYCEEVPGWGKVVFFIREDGTYDLINGYGVTSTNTFTVDGNSIVALDDNFGAFHCTVSSNGTEIYCAEVQTALKLSNDTSFAADDDYFYVYKEDLGGYEVSVIDKTKTSYSAIKTGINGIDTVKLADRMFANYVDGVYKPNTTLACAIVIPKDVMIIGDDAFKGCINMTSITIPDSVTTIGKEAFISCDSLNSVHITSLTNWCMFQFDEAIYNPIFRANNLYLCGKLIGDLVIPDGVENINENAFYNCKSLTSVTIPDSVINIGYGAFCGCDSLTSVTIPDSVINIDDSAFCGCDSLTSITIPDSVINIGSIAFKSCLNLKNIIFNGTISQWNAITINNSWNYNTPATHVQCSDGQVAL